MERHSIRCPQCRRFESSSSLSLNVLRSAALEPDIAPSFEDRVLRRLRVQSVKEGISYWSPAAVGASIACVAIFATLQIAAAPVDINNANLPDGEARRMLDPDRPMPSLVLEKKPVLVR